MLGCRADRRPGAPRMTGNRDFNAAVWRLFMLSIIERPVFPGDVITATRPLIGPKETSAY